MERTGKLLLITSLFLCFFGLKGWTRDRATNQPDSLELRLMEIYTKREVMIPMRDGVQLYTAIYEPKDNSRKHPTLMMRTPYSCSPYGEINPAKRNVMVVKNEMRLLKQKRNVLQI